MSGYHLAQTNLGRMAAPLDSPQIKPFMDALMSVNANADAAPGFVWRLQTEEGDATALTVFDGALMVNMSVWERLEDLRAFVYRDPAHLAIMRRRREFFEKIDLVNALWWVPAGHRPTLAELEDRYAYLRGHGPSPYAFSFQRHFPPPDAAAVDVVTDDRDLCPA